MHASNENQTTQPSVTRIGCAAALVAARKKDVPAHDHEWEYLSPGYEVCVYPGCGAIREVRQ